MATSFFNNNCADDVEEIESAKNYADLARDWAIKMDGLVDGIDFSSKYWALQSAEGAGLSVTIKEDGTPLGDTFTVLNFGAGVSATQTASNEVLIQSTGQVLVETFDDGVDFIAGTSDEITLATEVVSKNNIDIYFDGVYQNKETYDVSGILVTFDSIIPVGVGEIEVVYPRLMDIGVTSADNVTFDGSTVDAELVSLDGRLTIVERSTLVNRPFPNVAAVDTATFLQTGDFVEWLGYTTPGDGGGNKGEIGTGFGPADNGSVFDLSGSGLQAKGLFDENKINVKKFGASPSLVSNFSAFNSAITFARSQNYSVYIPYGIYTVNTDDGSLVFREVAIFGDGGQNAANGVSAGNPNDAVVINVIGSANPFAYVERGTEIRGITFFYPDQVTTGIPTSYPATLRFRPSTDGLNNRIGRIVIDDVVSYNSYDFIYIEDNSGAVGNIYIERCLVYAINTAIRLPEHNDAVRIDRCYFGPGIWDKSGSLSDINSLSTWTRLNASAIQHGGGADGFYIDNSIIQGYSIGIDFDGTDISALIAISLTSIEANTCIYIGSGAPATIFTATASKFITLDSNNPARVGMCIDYQGTAAARNKLTFSGCHFRESHSYHVRVGGSTTVDLSLTACSFHTPSAFLSAGGESSLRINNASARITLGNCQLYDSSGIASGVNILDGEDVKINECQFDNYDSAISLASCGDLSLIGNTSTNTVSAISDVVSASSVSGLLTNTLNSWDKPSGNTGISGFELTAITSPTSLTGSAQIITWTNTVADKGQNTSLTQFIADRPGTYSFSASVPFANGATPGDRITVQLIKRNASSAIVATRATRRAITAVGENIDITTNFELGVGFSVEVQVFRDLGAGAISLVTADADKAFFTGAFIS